MEKIRIGEQELEMLSLVQSGDRLTIGMVTDMSLDALAALLEPASAPEVRVLGEDGLTTAIYKSHAVTALEIRLINDARQVTATLQVEPIEQTEADALREQLAAQSSAIARQAEQATAQAQALSAQEAVLGAARIAARRIVMADAGVMEEEELTACAPLFEDWAADKAYVTGDVVAENGQLYRCLQGHTSQAGWQPSAAPALWARMGVTAAEPDAIPSWIQPTCAEDAYSAGDRVTYSGAVWTSDVDGNVWEPGVSGWTQEE